MIAVQLLDGITGSVVTILTILVIADLTAGTGRFNLAQGVHGALTGDFGGGQHHRGRLHRARFRRHGRIFDDGRVHVDEHRSVVGFSAGDQDAEICGLNGSRLERRQGSRIARIASVVDILRIMGLAGPDWWSRSAPPAATPSRRLPWCRVNVPAASARCRFDVDGSVWLKKSPAEAGEELEKSDVTVT
jgi:hypothetical protein